MRAQHANQPLRQYAKQAGGQKIGLDAHVGQTRHGARRVVGMQRCQHQMAGKRRLHGNLRRFQIADFTDHDHVRILAQQRAQRPGETQVDTRIYLRLRHAVERVFDGVFDGHHIDAGAVQTRQRGV